MISVGGEIFGTDTLPVTWQMLELPEHSFIYKFTHFSLCLNSTIEVVLQYGSVDPHHQYS